MDLFDTHAHLNSDAFEGQVDAVVTRAKQANVVGIAVIGVDLKTSRRAVQLANEYPGYLHAVVGIQPNSVAAAEADDFDQITALATAQGVVAIGETGLDRYWDDTPISDQIEVFERHLDLCLETTLPMVIHMRESGADIVNQLRARDAVPAGIMHSFTGDKELCKQCLDLGLMISFAGMVTFKKSDELRAVSKMVPDDRILIETDSPYLSPEPLRGKRPNEPARVVHTLRCIAEARGCEVGEMAEMTTANALRIFGIG